MSIGPPPPPLPPSSPPPPPPPHAAATPLAGSGSSATRKFPHVLICRLSSKAFENGSPGQPGQVAMKTSVQRSVKRKTGSHTTRYIAVWFVVVLREATLPPFFLPSNFQELFEY
jgi:hypothetical protein